MSVRRVGDEVQGTANRYHEIVQMNASANVKSHDLLGAFEEVGFDAAMRRLLTFLGVRQIDACLRVLSRLDTTQHASSHSSTKGDERAMLRRQLLSDRWTARVLGPPRAVMGFGPLPVQSSSST